ncbi:hypothetical protein [Kushneria aurantia]|uniref:Uncharacterized protein n=1 Tax=Kushneria aurantia TaxID=504092 RepID=A0ABV6G366_9GAMM|nr:hypothetical protein [Kushneria aurantia]
MSLKIRGVLCLALLLSLSGCFQLHTAQAPMATSWPLTEQRRMQAAHHWDVLARHEARAIMARQRLRGSPLYIAEPVPSTPFSRAFHRLLESQLVNNGALVSTQPEGSVFVDYDVQVVEHQDRGFIRRPEGTFTALAAGVTLAFQPINHWAEPALALIPGAALFDAFSGNITEVGDTEVIITTRASEYDTLLFSSSNIYYVNDGDSSQYAVREPNVGNDNSVENRGGLRLSTQW